MVKIKFIKDTAKGKKGSIKDTSKKSADFAISKGYAIICEDKKDLVKTNILPKPIKQIKKKNVKNKETKGKQNKETKGKQNKETLNNVETINPLELIKQFDKEIKKYKPILDNNVKEILIKGTDKTEILINVSRNVKSLIDLQSELLQNLKAVLKLIEYNSYQKSIKYKVNNIINHYILKIIEFIFKHNNIIIARDTSEEMFKCYFFNKTNKTFETTLNNKFNIMLRENLTKYFNTLININLTLINEINLLKEYTIKYTNKKITDTINDFIDNEIFVEVQGINFKPINENIIRIEHEQFMNVYKEPELTRQIREKLTKSKSVNSVNYEELYNKSVKGFKHIDLIIRHLTEDKRVFFEWSLKILDEIKTNNDYDNLKSSQITFINYLFDISYIKSEFNNIDRLKNKLKNEIKNYQLDKLTLIEISKNKKYLYEWLAFKLQDLTERIPTSLLFISDTQGTGKDRLREWVLNYIFGINYCKSVNQSALESDKNGYQFKSLFNFVSELKYNKNISQIWEKIKDEGTNRIIPLRILFKNLVNTHNYSNYVIFSNNRKIMPIHKDNRRLNIFIQDLKLPYNLPNMISPEQKNQDILNSELEKLITFLFTLKTCYDNVNNIIVNNSQLVIQELHKTDIDLFIDFLNEFNNNDSFFKELITYNIFSMGYIETTYYNKDLNDYETYISNDDLFQVFRFYCNRQNIKEFRNNVSFGLELKKLGFESYRIQKPNFNKMSKFLYDTIKQNNKTNDKIKFKGLLQGYETQEREKKEKIKEIQNNIIKHLRGKENKQEHIKDFYKEFDKNYNEGLNSIAINNLSNLKLINVFNDIVRLQEEE